MRAGNRVVSFTEIHIVGTSLIAAEWVNKESCKNAVSNHKVAERGNGASVVEGYLISHSSIKHAGISKAHPHPFILCPMPSRLSSGCLATGMLKELPAGSREHRKVTRCSYLFWPWEKVSPSSANKRLLRICQAGWWPGHPQSRLSMETKSVFCLFDEWFW